MSENQQLPSESHENTETHQAGNKYQDLGFGSKIGHRTRRMINPDGSFNVRKTGAGWRAIHPYQFLITIPWTHFNLVVGLFYLLLNSLFAGIYLLVGIEYLSGSSEMNIEWMPQWLDNFCYAFFFSVQTFTTVGYGTISPIGFAANFIASIEAMIGLMGFALATGVLYGRFSKATAKIRYSKYAIIAPYRDVNGFMFRIVNGRENHLIELSVQVTMSYYKLVKGEYKPQFQALELERNYVALFPLTWTIVHPIDENSPLYGLKEEDMEMMNPEFMVVIQGYDETFAQTVYSRMSYKQEDINWGKKFDMVYHTDEESGMIVVEVNNVGKVSDAKLNQY